MTDTPPATSVVEVAATAPARVQAIDGLRAVAALWVVLFHIHAFSGAHLPPGLEFIARAGSTGVSLFLVLSGLCLYLPYAGGRQSRFRTDDFFRRRVRRLLPAYYASLGVILAVYAVADGRWGLPRLTGPELLLQAGTHATLTHQFFPSTFYGLNGAYWSLGLEWELYLTLPLLVMAVRRFGVQRTVLSIVGISLAYRLGLWLAVQTGHLARGGIAATVLLPNFVFGRWSEFALGVWAAHLYRGGRASAVGRRWALPAVAAAILGLGHVFDPVTHLLFGVVFFSLLLAVIAG